MKHRRTFAGPRNWCVVPLTLLLICAPADAADGSHAGFKGLVVSVSAPASDVGYRILQRGGTAVDGAVATAFALAVTWPAAGNIGGGGFMMVYPGAGEQPVCVEYRETAPTGATPTMFAADSRKDGPKVSGVPGTVAGLALAHGKYGKLPWADVVMPAVRLARDGFLVDRALTRSLNDALKKSIDFPEFQRLFAPPAGRNAWREADRLIQPELARTLPQIASDGPDAFYRGSIAEQMLAEMQAGGGLLTKEDLASYQAHLRRPIHGTYRGYDIYGPPPPSSGGICLVEMLNILENSPLEKHPAPADSGLAPRWTANTMHLVLEAMRRAYCDRARYLGDADFTPIPAHLTSKEYAQQLARQIEPGRATRSEDVAPELVARR